MWTRLLVAVALLTTACGTTAQATTLPRAGVSQSAGSVAGLGDGHVHSPAAARKLADAALNLISFPAGSVRLATRPRPAPATVTPFTVITSQVTRTRRCAA